MRRASSLSPPGAFVPNLSPREPIDVLLPGIQVSRGLPLSLPPKQVQLTSPPPEQYYPI